MRPSFLAAIAMSASEIDLSVHEPGWIEAPGAHEFKAYYQDSEEGDTRKVMMVGVVNARPRDCFSVVTDYDRFGEFMPFVQFTKLLHSEKADPKKTLNYVFFYLNPPMIANRFYTIELTDEKDPGGKEGAFRSRWVLHNGAHRKALDDPLIRKHVKPSFKTPVETTFNEGYWLFEPMDDGKHSKVSYYVWTNPGGSIPAKIADKANAIALPKLWTALKNRLKEKKFLKE